MTNQQINTAAIKALCKAQSEMTGAIKGETNPHFRKKYADLGAVQDACLPALHKHGFAVIHVIGRDDGGAWLETSLLHESGDEPFSCRVPLRVDKDNMQGMGSAITYARRYGLMCVSGVAPEDDDGDRAADSPPKRETERAKDNTPPTAEDPFGPDDPPDDDKDAAREIAKLKTITDIAELGSYWAALNGVQNHIAKRPDVIAAKNDRKAVIGDMAPA